MEFRSLCDPIRRANEYVEYVEAACVDVDLKRTHATCESLEDELGRKERFDLHYDHLVICVGARPSTFGVPGVSEFAYFLKELGDARRLRGAIIDRLERASLPTTSEEEKVNLLHFVVVGGGPTGCERMSQYPLDSF